MFSKIYNFASLSSLTVRKFYFLFHIIMLFFFCFRCSSPQKKSSSTLLHTKNKSENTLYQVSDYSYEGIRILQAYHPTDLIVTQIYITGGIQFYDKEEEGIELLALKLAINGSSKNFSKQYLDEQLEKLGSQIKVFSGYDYSVITLICLKENFLESLQILMERLINPKFSLSEFYEIRDQYMAQRLEQEKNPWEQLRNWSFSQYFEGTSWALNPLGSYQSLFSFTNEGVNLFYQNLLAKKRIYITIVGKLKPEEVAIHFHRFFKNLPDETPVQKSNQKPVIYNTSNVQFQKKDGKISYINGIFSAPKPGTLDAIALQLALSILNERMQTKLIIHKGFLLEAFCGYAEFSNPIANLRFSTQLPGPAIRAVMDELYKLKTDGVTSQELHQKKQFFITQFYQKLANSETYAEMIGKAVFHYSWKDELKSIQKIETITNATILSVLQKYLKNIQWYFLGDTGKIGKGAFEKGL